MSRVLFIVLIGCALTFGSPVKVKSESNKVSGVSQQDVEEVAAYSKRIQVIEGVLRALYDVVEVGSDPDQIKIVIRNLNRVLKKAFNEDLYMHFEVINEKDVQKAMKIMVKRACEAFSEYLESFFEKVKKQLHDSELAELIEELEGVLENIFDYQVTENKRRIKFVEDEEVQKLTPEEFENISNGFKDTFAGIVEEILNQLIEQLSAVEGQADNPELEQFIEELKHVLGSITNHNGGEKKRSLILAEDEDVQKLTPEEFENISNGFKDTFAGIVEEILNQLIEQLSAVEGQVDNPELEQFIEELKHVLGSISNPSHNGDEKKRSLSLVDDESVQKITPEESEHISNGFKETFVKIVEAILKQLVGQLSEEEKQELIEAIKGMQGFMDQ